MYIRVHYNYRTNEINFSKIPGLSNPINFQNSEKNMKNCSIINQYFLNSWKNIFTDLMHFICIIIREYNGQTYITCTIIGLSPLCKRWTEHGKIWIITLSCNLLAKPICSHVLHIKSVAAFL